MCSLKNGMKIFEVSEKIIAIATIEQKMIFALDLRALLKPP